MLSGEDFLKTWAGAGVWLWSMAVREWKKGLKETLKLEYNPSSSS